jgi:26S proteasome regulatory subunit N5
MVVGEFTVSNISMEEDKREEEKNKQASTLDLEKFKADVDAAAALAKVRTTALKLPPSACSTPHIQPSTHHHHYTPQGNLNGSLDALLTLEKTARMAEDITACKASCSAIVTVCYEAKQWKLLEENVVLLSKRRGQLKQVGLGWTRQLAASQVPSSAFRRLLSSWNTVYDSSWH